MAFFICKVKTAGKHVCLRSVKNRFGTINELGFFEMDETGMQEVANINQQLLNEMTYDPGSALISIVKVRALYLLNYRH